MNNPLNKVFIDAQSSIVIAECLGIANRQQDTQKEFAQKCISSTFNLSNQQCKDICQANYLLFANHRQRSPWMRPEPLIDEPLEVSFLKGIWEDTIYSLKEKFKKALYIEKLLHDFESDNPITSIQSALSFRFERGSTSLQKDLKPVLIVLNAHTNELLAGIGQLAWELHKDEKIYAKEVSSVFIDGSIPQKGLHFAVTLLASCGDAPVKISPRALQNLKYLLEPPTEAMRTADIGRLSETKTVLRVLGLAQITPQRHHAVAHFTPEVRKLLTEVIARAYKG